MVGSFCGAEVPAQPPPGLPVGLSKDQTPCVQELLIYPGTSESVQTLDSGPPPSCYRPQVRVLLCPSLPLGPSAARLSTYNPMASPTACYPSPRPSSLPVAAETLPRPVSTSQATSQQPRPLQFPFAPAALLQGLGGGYEGCCELHRGRGHPRGLVAECDPCLGGEDGLEQDDQLTGMLS